MSPSVLASARLTPCQERALEILRREGNVFLTGAAGTGKSFLLDLYVRGKGSDDFPIVASTGAAAVIVGGRTFHSFFGLGIMEGGAHAAVQRAVRNRRVAHRMQRACCVIIDEISMLSGLTLQAAEMVARITRRRDEPWGGLRIIAVGDFAQLPPIVADSRSSVSQERQSESKDWAFRHAIWNDSDFTPALLSTVMRTQDTEFLEILNFVREGIVNERVRDFLRQRTVEAFDTFEGTRLYPHRAQAELYNKRRLESLPQKLFEFPTQYAGSETYLESTKRVVPIPEVLHLKVGALIMMRKNDISGEMRYVNGSLGNIVSIDDDVLRVRLLTGEEIEVVKDNFSSLDGDGNVVMTAWNFPVTLAWATTIHKAQGASLDRMIVDLHQLWEPGQAYVALSRVRSGDGLFLERWSKESIRAEPLVTAFYDSLADTARKYKPRPLFVPPVTKEETREAVPKRMTPAQRLQTVRTFLQEGKGIAAIAEACAVTPETILRYIEKLLTSGTSISIAHLADTVPDADRIRSLYQEHGFERMKPVFEALEGSASYDDLRLMRLVMLSKSLSR